MIPKRRRSLFLFLGALLVLAAGYGAGYARAYGQFYSPEALLDRELLHMDFNSRLLHYTLLGQQADCRRELVRRLQGEVAFVGQQLNGGLPPDYQTSVRESVANARTVMEGRPLSPSLPPPPQKERD